MPERDWYPASMDSRAAWWANFILRRPDFEAKYPVLHTLSSELQADNSWIQYWVEARHAADELSQQLTRYFNTIAGNDATADPPAPIVWTLPPAAPAEAKPGIERRIREVRRDVVGQIDYAKADGDALGFELPEAPAVVESDVTAAFEAKTLVAFEVQFSFKKRGLAAMRFEYRHKGGNWAPAGTLINSPGALAIPPTTPGTAEQIEVRAVYLDGNTPYGNYSDAKTVLIAP